MPFLCVCLVVVIIINYIKGCLISCIAFSTEKDESKRIQKGTKIYYDMTNHDWNEIVGYEIIIKLLSSTRDFLERELLSAYVRIHIYISKIEHDTYDLGILRHAYYYYLLVTASLKEM